MNDLRMIRIPISPTHSELICGGGKLAISFGQIVALVSREVAAKSADFVLQSLGDCGLEKVFAKSNFEAESCFD